MVKRLVLRFKQIVLFLQETKLGVFDSGVSSLLGGNLLTRGIGVEVEGASGGLIILWNDDFFKVSSCIPSKRSIIMAGELIGLKKELVFCNIYATNVEREEGVVEYIIFK